MRISQYQIDKDCYFRLKYTQHKWTSTVTYPLFRHTLLEPLRNLLHTAKKSPNQLDLLYLRHTYIHVKHLGDWFASHIHYSVYIIM